MSLTPGNAGGLLADAVASSVAGLTSMTTAPGQPGPAPAGAITAIIGLTGQLRGTVMVGVSERLGRECARAMFMEESRDMHCVWDAVGELANVIAGQVVVALAESVGDIHLSVPVVGTSLATVTPGGEMVERTVWFEVAVPAPVPGRGAAPELEPRRERLSVCLAWKPRA